MAKERLIARHHAIVHTGAACPPPLDKEIEFGKGSLMKPSVRVVPDSPTEKLDPESRISYSEVYTVHLSVKVKCFGMIHPGSHDVLRYSYQAVQEDVISSEFGRDAKAVAVLVDR